MLTGYFKHHQTHRVHMPNYPRSSPFAIILLTLLQSALNSSIATFCGLLTLPGQPLTRTCLTIHKALL